MRTTLPLALAAAALLGAAAPAGAQTLPFTLDFDAPGATAELFAPVGVTIGYGVFGPELDEFGDPIPDSDQWTLDVSVGSVPVIDPSTVGYGAAPSVAKALDARDGTVLLVFSQPISLTAFSATLDNSTFGNLFNSPIEFFDSNDELLFAINVDQTVPGFVASASGLNLTDVKTVVLPGGAFYDNIQAVPEPGTWMLLLGGLAFTIYRLRRPTRA